MPAGVLDGATHLYMANLCFPEALNHAMTTALAAVSPPPGGSGPLPPLAVLACCLPSWRCNPCVLEAAAVCIGGCNSTYFIGGRIPHVPGGLAAVRPHAARPAAARGMAHRRQGVPGSPPRARRRGERGHELGRQRRRELLLL